MKYGNKAKGLMEKHRQERFWTFFFFFAPELTFLITLFRVNLIFVSASRTSFDCWRATETRNTDGGKARQLSPGNVFAVKVGQLNFELQRLVKCFVIALVMMLQFVHQWWGCRFFKNNVCMWVFLLLVQMVRFEI